MSIAVLPGVALVTLVALALYLALGIRVSLLRGRYKVNAPAMTGPAGFENGQRIFLNTLEQLVPFLAALWLCALLFSVRAAEILGVVWIVGRVLYAVSYTRSPSKRGPGFGIAWLATALLMLGAAVGSVRILLI